MKRVLGGVHRQGFYGEIVGAGVDTFKNLAKREVLVIAIDHDCFKNEKEQVNLVIKSPGSTGSAPSRDFTGCCEVWLSVFIVTATSASDSSDCQPARVHRS